MEANEDQMNNFGESGHPIFGAIFMANRSTKTECLKRNLFGLPPPQANFVKKVKSGMILFLFEFEERKLYGVFQASSDGAMNIVPHAFKSSGKQFPAQIRIKSIWNCKPLSESDFRDAIRDNYYTANKFNQGLSEDQVSKLLQLFESRKVKVQKSKGILSRVNSTNSSVSPDYGRVFEDDEHIRKSRLAIMNEHIPSDSGKSRLTMIDERIPSDSGKSRLAMINEPFEFARHPSYWPNSNVPSVLDNMSPELEGSAYDRMGSENMYRKYSSPYSHTLAHDDGMGLEHMYKKYSSPYSQNLADGVFPSSGTQIVPFHLQAEKIKQPPMRSGNLEFTSSFPDYIPLGSANHYEPISSSMLSSQSLSSKYKSVTPRTLETYESVTFPKPSLATFPSSTHESLGRDNLSSSFGPAKDHPPYVPDHHCPARNGDSMYSNFQLSPPTASSYKSHFQVDSHPLDTQSIHFQKLPEHDNPTDVRRDEYGAHTGLRSDTQYKPTDIRRDKYGAQTGLRSDTPNKRISVFSRLNARPKDTVHEDDDEYIAETDHADLSVSQIMGTLSQYQKEWRNSTEKPKRNSELNAADDNIQLNQTRSECEDALLSIEEELCNDILVEDPPINFKRRTKNRKIEEGFKEEFDGLSGTARKRRKLLRPSFVIEGIHNKENLGDNCPKVDQEIIECKGGGSEKTLISIGTGEHNEEKAIMSDHVCPEHNSVKTEIPEVKNDDSSKQAVSRIAEEGPEKDSSQFFSLRGVDDNDEKSGTWEGKKDGNGDTLHSSNLELKRDKSGSVSNDQDLRMRVKAFIQELNDVKD